MAAAAVGFSLSTSVQGLKHCIRSKNWASSSDPLLRLASTRVLLQAGLVSQTHAPEASWIGPISQKGRIPRISATVAQEEAAPPAEGVEEKEVSGGGDDKADEASAPTAPAPVVNTRLYFGNLPYHCDSAQLAGIIQEYGSPELVELYQHHAGKSIPWLSEWNKHSLEKAFQSLFERLRNHSRQPISFQSLSIYSWQPIDLSLQTYELKKAEP